VDRQTLTSAEVSLISKLTQLEKRVGELNALGIEVIKLGGLLADEKWLEGSAIREKGEEFYRGARALLEAQGFSGLAAFDWCYYAYYPDVFDKSKNKMDLSCIHSFIHNNILDSMHVKAVYPGFAGTMSKAIALLKSCVAELKSREVPIRSELSFVVVSDEFEAAGEILKLSNNEAIIRASGVIAGVALERHFRTVADERNVAVVKNPPAKTHSDFSDVILALRNASIITEVQRSRLETLYKIRTNCAHPKEVINRDDVDELIRDGKSFTALIQ
jgi:hypothetical protein